MLGFPNTEGITYLGAVVVYHYLKNMQPARRTQFSHAIDHLLLHNYLRVNDKYLTEAELNAIIDNLEQSGEIELDDDWQLPLDYLPAILKQISGNIDGEAILRHSL